MIILKIIGLIFVAIGVKLVYDARLITIDFFSFGDLNEATSGFKILGFIISIIGGLMIYFL